MASEKIRFWHRLDGRDTDWVDAGTRRAAFYTNLPSGVCRFQVRASNEDGVRSASAANVAIAVLPHLYQTRAFLFACLEACALAAWAVYAVRLRQLTVRLSAVKGERNRMAREIHDTLLRSAPPCKHSGAECMPVLTAGPTFAAADTNVQWTRWGAGRILIHMRSCR